MMFNNIKNLAVISFCFAMLFSITNINVLKAQENKKPQTAKCKIQCDVQSFYDKDMIEKKLKEEVGVTEAYLDLDEKIVYVDYDKNIINSEKICKIVKDLGYEAKLLEEKDQKYGENDSNKP